MNYQIVIDKLKKQYPGKKIILNIADEPTEIVCETESTDDHKDWSRAIAVIDSSLPHVHYETTEEYLVLAGELSVFLNEEKYTLRVGEKITIPPGAKHYAIGDETWVEVTANPGWTLEDHILS